MKKDMTRKVKIFLNGLFCKNANKKKTCHSFENCVSNHFLFNSLNSVISLCHKDPEAAAELVGEISTYLQRSMEDKPALIPLDEELEHVLSYTNIQKARFPERLKIITDIDDGIQCQIPAFTLQPVVDNAIRHGVLKRKQGGTVGISIKKLPDSVKITIQDDGTGMTDEQLDALLKRRNKRPICKVNHALRATGIKGLEISSTHNEGTAVIINIPI